MLTIMMDRMVEQSLDPRLGKAPRARIQWLLLRPNNVLGIRVLVEVLLELSPGEGVQLLDTGDGCIFYLLFRAMFVQCRINLPGAKDDSLNLVVVIEFSAVFGILNDPLEMGLSGKVLDWRASNGMTKK